MILTFCEQNDWALVKVRILAWINVQSIDLYQ